MIFNNKPEIGLLADENDLETLSETVFGAARNNFASAEIFACANESNAAPLVLTGTDAVVVGAKIESATDSLRVAKMLRELKTHRDKDRHRALLGVILWGSRASEFQALTQYKNVFVAASPAEEKHLQNRFRLSLDAVLPFVQSCAPLTRYEILAQFINQQNAGQQTASVSHEIIAVAVQNELNQANERAQELENRITALNQEIFERQGKFEELTVSEQKLRSDYAELVAHLRASCSETIAELTGRSDEIRSLRKELERTHENFGMAVESLRANATHTANGESVAHFREQLDEGNQQAWTTLLKVDQKRFEVLTSQLTASEIARQTLAAEVDILRTALADAAAEKEILIGQNTEIQNLQSRISELEFDLRDVTQERGAMLAQIENIETEREIDKSGWLKMQSENAELQTQLEALKQQLDAAAAHKDETSRDSELREDAARDEIQQLRQQVSTFEIEKEDLLNEMIRLEGQIDKLTAETAVTSRRASEEIYSLTSALQDFRDASENAAKQKNALPAAVQQIPETAASRDDEATQTARPLAFGVLSKDHLATMTFAKIPFDLLHEDSEPAETVEIEKLLREVGQSVAPLLKGKDVKIDYEINPRTKFITSQGNKLRQIIFNLLANSIAATEKGLIIIQTDQLADGTFSLSIVDSGCGIQPENLETIFQSDPDKAESECSLPATQKMVKSLGGEICARSWIELGSLFVIRLPGSVTAI